MSAGNLNLSRRLRRTPFTEKVEALGVRGFSVVNHMLLPKAFQPSVEEDYWHLREHVQIWDVSCQRQVEIRGADAARLVQWMTPRNLSRTKPGDCLYAPLVDQNGGMINDPVILKLSTDRFWLSIADSDVLLWAKGLALGAALDVEIQEPDVSPLAIQGPRAEDLMVAVFGEALRGLGFFKFSCFEFLGTQQVIARSGYSRQGGFEIYLNDTRLGGALWDRLWEAGQAFNIRPGYPNLIDRIEGGLLSYGNEMTLENNPLECGLEKFCDLHESPDCIGTTALRNIAAQGVTRQICGLIFDGARCPTCATPWPVVHAHDRDTPIGQVTSAIYSPRLCANIALGMVAKEFCNPGQRLLVRCVDGTMRTAEVSSLPID